MIRPPALRENDLIGLAAPARKISEEELQPAVNFLEKSGFRVKFSSTLFEEDHQQAGDAETRTRGMQELLDDPEVKAIWCVRGGYGTAQIIDLLDFSAFRNSPKWVCGYSDITVLHCHLQMLGFQSLHCTMPVNVTENTSSSLDSMIDVLTGGYPYYTFAPHPLNREGEARARITGGNMSVIYSLMGSETASPGTWHILFLEDLDEYLYHIDRMMVNFKRSGMLERLKGVVCGGLTDMNDNKIPWGYEAEEIVASHLADRAYPLCFDFPAGHMDHNLSLVMGAEVGLHVGSECRLKFIEENGGTQ